MKRVLVPALSLLMLAACSKDDVQQPQVPGLDKVEIQVETGVGKIELARAGEGMINNTLLQNLEAQFALLTQGASAYPAYTAGDVYPVTVLATNNVMSFQPARYYDDAGKNSKIIGWYPRVASGWDHTTRTVTFPVLDGETDLMTTASAEGNKEQQNRIRTVVFDHELTQISLHVYANNQESKDKWGKLTGVSIEGKGQSAVLTLPSVTDAAGSRAAIAFSGTAALALVQKNPVGNVTVGYPVEMNIAAADGSAKNEKLAGYAMFSPYKYVAGNELIINVKTKKGSDAEVTTPIKITRDLDKGTAYKLTLKFTKAEIKPDVTITDWKSQEIGEIEI